MIDTHSHLDGEEFAGDLSAVIERAKASGIEKIFIPGINAASLTTVFKVCDDYAGYCYPMIGLQPEEVGDDWQQQLNSMEAKIHACLDVQRKEKPASPLIAIGECGLDFYWTREHENEQLKAFEWQVELSVSTGLPLMIHCRKAQAELTHILRQYERELPGGVFHCFTGNKKEAEEYMRFDKFVIGVGGVLTFKSSHLREDLPAAVPLSRIVLETDSPYMAPVPHRGTRNESAFVADVARQLAVSYNVSLEEVDRVTTENAMRIFKEL